MIEPSATCSCLLLVEDDDLVRGTVALMLEEEGFQVIEAADANEALSMIRSNYDFSAMITDVDLGGGPSGMDVADTLHRERPELPVIFITGRAGALFTRRLEAREALLPKPFESEALSRVIRRMTKAA